MFEINQIDLLTKNNDSTPVYKHQNVNMINLVPESNLMDERKDNELVFDDIDALDK